MFLANNLPEFKQHFIQQLHEMLQSDSLGAFILVLANSMQDEVLYEALKAPITKRFKALCANTPDAPIDDQRVFSQIKQSGIDALTCWEYSNKAVWEFVYNPLRAMRPARASQELVEHIQQPFDINKFNFNKPFLKPEILWEGEFLGSNGRLKNIRVLYNKFPFAPWHLLIVPEPEKEQSQYITQEAHHDIFSLSANSSHLEGFGVGYNSLGANASINQLHFQGFIRQQALPIEASVWKHNGGDQDYPIKCLRYQHADQAWQSIEALHQLDQPYTVLYRKGFCYVIARQGQGRAELPDWAKGTAWHEVCGVFTLANKNVVEDLSSDEVYRTLSLLNISVC